MIRQLTAMTLMLPYLALHWTATFLEDTAELLENLIDKLVDEDEADVDSPG